MYSRDVTAAMLVYKNNRRSLLWEPNPIFMQIPCIHFVFFCTPLWPPSHVSENHLLTMNGAFHPKSDVDRLYVSRVNGGRVLISCEGCVRSEENSLEWYVKNSLEVLLQGVGATSVIRSEETVSKDEFKTSWINEKLDSWKEKRLHGQFVTEIPETTHVEESWSWSCEKQT